MATYTMEDKRRFAEWLETPPAVRRKRRLPTTRAAYAKKNGITDRTLRRWENEDTETATLRGQAKAKWESAGPGADLSDMPESPEGDPPLVDTASEYDDIRRNLISLAKEGDPKALAEYMRYFGKFEEERRREAAQRGLVDMSDDDLVDRTLRLIGRERILEWLDAG